MPAFTFEKISPPVPPGPVSPSVKKQRGLIVQILDRLVEARQARSEKQEKGVIGHNPTRPSD